MIGLEVTIEDSNPGPAVVLRCRGFIDSHTFLGLEEPLECALARDAMRIVVDLREVTYISSAGLGVLVGAHKQAEERGGLLVLACPRPEICTVLEDTGLADLLVIAPSEHEALRCSEAGMGT
jgi:anti-sigma B factor antagonist